MRCSQGTWSQERNEAWGCHPPQVCACRFSNRAPHGVRACAGHCRARLRKYALVIVEVVGCEPGWGGGMVFHKACVCSDIPDPHPGSGGWSEEGSGSVHEELEGSIGGVEVALINPSGLVSEPTAGSLPQPAVPRPTTPTHGLVHAVDPHSHSGNGAQTGSWGAHSTCLACLCTRCGLRWAQHAG